MRPRVWLFASLAALLAGCGLVPISFQVGLASFSFSSVPLYSASQTSSSSPLFTVQVPSQKPPSLPLTPSRVTLSVPISQLQITNLSPLCGGLSSLTINSLSISGNLSNSTLSIPFTLSWQGSVTFTAQSNGTYLANTPMVLSTSISGQEVNELLSFLSQGGTLNIMSYSSSTSAPQGCTATVSGQASGQGTAYF